MSANSSSENYMSIFKKRGCWLALAATGLSGSLAHAQLLYAPSDNWTRGFRLGGAVGFNIKGSFNVGGALNLTGRNPGPAGVSGANHTYDNGYVLVDKTGNAQGYTAYFGYDNRATQYAPMAQTLTFQSANSAILDPGSSSHSDSPYLGIDLAYLMNVGHFGGARVGIEFGFGFLPISIKDRGNLSGIFSSTTHQYSVPAGVTLPNTTSYQAGPNAIGPVIFDQATDISSAPSAGVLHGTRTLDVDLYHLRIGPTLYWDLTHRWGVSASAGGAFGLVNGEYRFDETATLQSGGTTRLTGKFGKLDPVYGGYANAIVYYHLQKDADLFLGAQFLSLSKANFSTSGRQAKLDMSAGLFVTAGINWMF